MENKYKKNIINLIIFIVIISRIFSIKNSALSIIVLIVAMFYIIRLVKSDNLKDKTNESNKEKIDHIIIEKNIDMFASGFVNETQISKKQSYYIKQYESLYKSGFMEKKEYLDKADKILNKNTFFEGLQDD